ncbi:P-loop containing nucleoside triphosphate hydrolase protein [Terfezia claveryi]|nr:P-loop containing nucleoside triphosphate hydrolase protein [Terfezia claveryi]
MAVQLQAGRGARRRSLTLQRRGGWREGGGASGRGVMMELPGVGKLGGSGRGGGGRGGGGGGGGRSQNNNSITHGPPAPEKGGQFISSLWTCNPTSTSTSTTTTTATAPPPPETEQTPTNAPLSDGSATFTTLGLSPSLATHLTTKLHLKAPTAIQKAAIPELLSSDSDAFIQAQTGSGKTLTYLLPILDRIQSLSAVGGRKPDRSSGLFALVLAPTRELAAQISSVLTQLTGSPSLHWITPTCVTGGEKRKSEKARLRKGCNILIATPGRLLDHLEMTESLDVANVRWMVMDEGDRLADQGFEKEIAKILEIIEKRSKLKNDGESRLPKKRVTVLCSATLGAGVQKLGDISLKEASFIKADLSSSSSFPSSPSDTVENNVAPSTEGETFLAPAQLRQSYLLVPPKQRYVALYAALKRAFVRASPNMKVIVFFSCADSVDFHFEVFSRSLDEKGEDKDTTKRRNNPEKKTAPSPSNHQTIRPAPLLHDSLVLCKLHGSLPQAQRTESLKAFTTGHLPTPPKPRTPKSSPETINPTTTTTTANDPITPPPKNPKPTPPTPHPTILFSTDVSSRGLDLPNVDLIIQFDPPFSRSDYLHRIGRTARAGRPGRAMIFLLPGTGEEEYVEKVMTPTCPNGVIIREQSLSEVFEKGFNTNTNIDKDAGVGVRVGVEVKGTGKGKKKESKFPPWEDRATTLQLSLEEHLMHTPAHLSLAKRAWTSHVRAYATHEAAERGMFDVRRVHMGHLAKGFGLRERPGEISHHSQRAKGAKKEGAGAGGKMGKVLERVARREGKARWDREDEVGKVGGGGGDGGEEGRQKMRRLAKMMQGRGLAKRAFD